MKVLAANISMGRALLPDTTQVNSFCQTTTDSSTDVDELKKNFRAMQEENNKLQAVITDVTEVNKQWQKYNNDRQLYVQCLLSTIQDQQEKMNKTVEKRVFPAKTQGITEEERKMESLRTENVWLKEEVASLQRRLEQKEKEHHEHVEVLEFQVKAHRDDWEAERSEKQQALKHKEALELRVQELLREVCGLRLKMNEEQVQKQCVHCCGCEDNCCSGSSDSKSCSKDHPKTYRTSVHLPCTSGRVLPKEKPCCSESAGDNNAADPDSTDKAKCSTRKKMSSRSSSLEEPQSVHEEGKVFRHNGDDFSAKKEELADKAFSNMEHRYSCSVLHISPTASGSSLAGEESSIDSTVASSGVTIGFNSSGLASVTSFMERPVVKSSSMPISEMIGYDSDRNLRPTFSQCSLDSDWSSIVGPPTARHMTANISEEKSFSMLKTRNLTKSESNVTATNVRKSSVPWKAKYFEEGVATQTKEDVICPGCGQIFPPNLHLQFLDHFEVCQQSAKDSSKKKWNLYNFRN